MSLFVKGLIVGFCLAAPVGPIAAICVQRTIAKRWLSGVVSGLGAAVADALYGAVAAFGATIISEFLITERAWLQRIGGAILILLGLRLLFFSKSLERKKEADKNRNLVGDFLSTFVLTLTNPMTFVAFAAIFTTMGIGAVRGQPILTAELVGGVFIGSELWWLILAGGAHALRQHFDFRKLTTINRATGVFVIAVGLIYLLLKTTSDNPTPLRKLVPQRLRASTPTQPRS
jgi:threonine/homoserine/homoserine lactone efflux protein